MFGSRAYPHVQQVLKRLQFSRQVDKPRPYDNLIGLFMDDPIGVGGLMRHQTSHLKVRIQNQIKKMTSVLKRGEHGKTAFLSNTLSEHHFSTPFLNTISQQSFRTPFENTLRENHLPKRFLGIICKHAFRERFANKLSEQHLPRRFLGTL